MDGVVRLMIHGCKETIFLRMMENDEQKGEEEISMNPSQEMKCPLEPEVQELRV